MHMNTYLWVFRETQTILLILMLIQIPNSDSSVCRLLVPLLKFHFSHSIHIFSNVSHTNRYHPECKFIIYYHFYAHFSFPVCHHIIPYRLYYMYCVWRSTITVALALHRWLLPSDGLVFNYADVGADEVRRLDSHPHTQLQHRTRRWEAVQETWL